MKVFLGNSPWKKEGFYGVRAGSRWPHFEKLDAGYMPFPFFLAYASSLLKKNGVEVLIVDGIAEDISGEEFLKRINEFKPHLAVFEVSTNSMAIDLRFARETREILKNNGAIAFCGPDMNMYNDKFLKENPDIDFVLKGEYEFTLLEMTKVFERGNRTRLDQVKGIFFRDEKGEIHFTGERELISNLDLFPWPDRDSLPMERYNDIPGGIPRPSVQMWASRGCPYQCIFCSWPQIMYGSHAYRTRNPTDVVDEMEWLVRNKGFKSVYFDDDTFNIGKPRILAICNEIKKRNLKVPWAVMARADTADREMLEAMKDAGLYALKYGVESGVQEIIDNCGKKLDLKKVRETIKITKELGIKFHLTFAFGLPGETMETIKRTIDFAIEQDPDSLQFSIITPFPGSKYYDDLEKKGFILSKNWEDYDGYNKAVIRTENLTKDELEEGLRMANCAWEEHLKRKDIKLNKLKYLMKGLKNPFYGAKRFWEIFYR